MSRTSRKIKKIEKTFNKASMGLVSYLSNLFPKSYFAQNEEMIFGLIKEKPSEPIAYFTTYVYKDDEYREQLINGNESFFMNHNWENVPNMEAEIIKKIFDFKDLWLILDDSDKINIKGIMKGFVVLCEKYIFALVDDLEARKFRESKIQEEEEGENEECNYDIDSLSIESVDKKTKSKSKSKHSKQSS